MEVHLQIAKFKVSIDTKFSFLKYMDSILWSIVESKQVCSRIYRLDVVYNLLIYVLESTFIYFHILLCTLNQVNATSLHYQITEQLKASKLRALKFLN